MATWLAVKLCVLLLRIMVGVSSLHASSIDLCSISPDPNPLYSWGELVNCSYRNLDSVPDDIPITTTTLLLSHNDLTEVPDLAFLNLTELRDLNLSANSITTLHQNAFVGLGKLKRLSLWDNKLNLSPQTYPTGLFAPLVSLTTLILNHNSRTHFTEKKLEEPRKPAIATKTVDDILTFHSDVISKMGDTHARHNKGLPQASENRNTQAEVQTVSKPSSHNTDVMGGEVVELGYPDEALSCLGNLTHLSIDGLTNKSFGPGFRKLTKLTHLEMNGKTGFCKLGIFSIATAANLSTLTHLNLSDCAILNLTHDAFRSLNNLEYLDLSFNQELGFMKLGEAFYGLGYTKLQTLYIDSVVHSRSLSAMITTDDLRFIRGLRHLRRLYARYNRIFAIDERALCQGMPPNLEYVNVDGNLFELAPYVNDIGCLQSLEKLDLNGLEASSIPPLRPPDPDISRTSFYTPHLYRKAEDDSNPGSEDNVVENDKSWNTCKGKHFNVPPKLHTFRASNFGLVYKLDKVRINATNSLKVIDLHKNNLPYWHGPLCGFENVTKLYMMNTMVEYISDSFFPSFPALEILNISNNYLRQVFQNDNEGKIFRGLKNLRVLDMSINDIGHINNQTLLPLENLEELYLSVNGMGSFTMDVTHMTRLRNLDISKNQLHTIPKETRDHLDWLSERYNVSVNMTFNPITCICSNIEFLRWIRESNVNFGTTRNYFCQMSDGSEKYMHDLMGTIAELEHTCGSYVGVFVGASACCVTLGVLMLVALGYRFRWKLRYLYYASRLSLRRSDPEDRQREYDFDAFISFSSEDDDFVQGDLKQKMEEKHGLRLCIHTRDFTPGQYIASSIVDSVQRSRRTLVVLTRALMESDWCHYELQMALMEAAYTGRDVLVFLLYESVPAHELTRDMLANLQSTVYIEFPHGEDDKELFWSRLAQALRQ